MTEREGKPALGAEALPGAPADRMHPIAELTQGEARGLSAVVFDVDDTLTRDGKLEDVAFGSLWRLRQAGLLLVAVTGRPLGFAELMARMWPIDLAVGENGAGHVRVTAEGVQTGHYAAPAQLASDADRLRELTARILREAPWVQLSDDHWARRCDVAFDIGERVQLAAERVERLRTLIEASGARFVASSVHAHAMLGGYDKAEGVVRAAADALGVDVAAAPERFLFVGDSGNDAAAFAYFPLSAAVANVRRHLVRLPVQPRYVSRADHGQGFAEIVNTVLERRR